MFRVDFLNATNSPQFFGGPVVDINSANFGRISGTADQSNLPHHPVVDEVEVLGGSAGLGYIRRPSQE